MTKISVPYSLSPPPMPEACELCQRQGEALTKHHLIPKTHHNKPKIRKRFTRQQRLTQILWVCRPCHDHLHRCFSESELAARLYTKEALLAETCMQTFLAWIQTRPSGFRPKSPHPKMKG